MCVASQRGTPCAVRTASFNIRKLFREMKMKTRCVLFPVRYGVRIESLYIT
jgi:hypothetical protein